MSDDRDPAVNRPDAADADPDATVRKPLWAFWRRAPAADERDATTVVRARTVVVEVDPSDTAETDRDDSDATVIRNTAVLTGDATRVDADRTVHRGTTLRPLPKRSLALPKGLQLHEYRIERVLGQGGFGITYLATDVNLDAKVAIKEYLPEEIAFRANDRSVSPNASQHRDRYQQGLDNFLTEARTLASFRHPNIVRVARFFEAHTTAYMVLEYERGQSFKKWWTRQTPDTESTLAPGQSVPSGERLLVERLQPLLHGLSVVHASGYLHRDIKPDNIQVRSEDGRFVLLDFGSAGQTVALADQDAVVVTPGYAPIEQYGVGEQGAWTDIYALGATLYWAVAGRKPPDAEARAAGASLTPAAEVGKGRFGEAFLEAIDWALQMDAAQRPPSVEAWRQRLLADHVSSLGLKEALRRHREQLLEEGSRSGQPAWLTRGRRLLRLRLLRAWPLGPRLALAAVVAAVLPLLLGGLLLLGSSHAALQDALLRQAEGTARSSAGRLAQLVAAGTRQARSLAADAELARALDNPPVAGPDSPDPRLQALMGANADIEWVQVIDTGGGVRLTTAPAPPGAASVPLVEAARDRPAGAVFATAVGSAAVVVAEPVRNVAGLRVGTVLLRIRGAAIAGALDAARADDGLGSLLVDEDGVVVHHPQADRLYRSLVARAADDPVRLRAEQRYQRQALAPLDEPTLAAVAQGPRQPGHLLLPGGADGTPRMAGHAPVPGQRWTVFVMPAPERLQHAQTQQRLQLVVGLVLAALAAAATALLLSRRLVQPLRALEAGATALKAGQFEQAYVDVQRRDELGELARSFNATVDVIRQRERERATRRR